MFSFGLINTESLIDIIQLGSIIITGSLGIAGTITHTKDEKGNLTKWGIITVVGIMLTNSFSFIESYLKQQKDKTDQIESLQKEKAKAIADNLKYKQTITLLSDNIHKADSSLAKQLVIQKQSGKVLRQVHESILLQDKTFKASQVLNNQQHEATDDIERTLNPLLPFKIDLTLLITPNNKSSMLLAFGKLLHRDIDSAKDLSWKSDIVKIDNPKGTAYLMKASYKNYDFFNDRINHIRIAITFSRHLKDGSVRTLECEVPEEYMRDKNNFNDIEALYLQNQNAYTVTLEKLPIKVLSYAGVGFNSTKDLSDATIKVQFTQAPGDISKMFMKFRFPPDFSRINELQISNKGENVQDGFYSNYTLTTNYKEK